MLHSTLPRAFLTPGLKYLSGYYGEDVAAYPTSSYPVPFDENYSSRVTEHHVFPTWHTVQRPASPCPLDLSLKTSNNKIDENLFDESKTSELQLETHHHPHDVRRYVLAGDDHEIIEKIDKDISETAVNHDPQTLISDKTHPSIRDIRIPRVPVEPDRDLDRLESDHEIDQVIRVYPEEEDLQVQLTSPRYNVSGEKIILQSPNIHLQPLPGYPSHHHHHHQLLMTPQHQLQGIHAPMTPPSTPSPPQCPRKRRREEPSPISPTATASASGSAISTKQIQLSASEKPPRQKKKHARRLKFDEDTSSPVSGTVILGPDEAVVTGDIDPAFNVVEVTEEARAELAKIENRLGPYQCRLCRQLHDDAFQLAQHRCSRIAHVEYRCPECDKRFSCPANLASHRRWHKPRVAQQQSDNNVSGVTTNRTTPSLSSSSSSSSTSPGATANSEFSCSRCEAKFSRQASLRKHMASQHSETNNNIVVVNSNSGRSSTGSCTSVSSLPNTNNMEQVLKHVGGHLGNSPLTVEMP